MSELWLDLSRVGNTGFLRMSAVRRFSVLPAGGGIFYVTAELDNGTTQTVAADFATADDARDWVLDTIKSANVR